MIAVWPVLLGAGWLLSLLGPLLAPSRALANRDIASFHLPLRATFKDLAAFGLPGWNPWLHGGQPILSNPSYGAFYPPSWLVFAAPPAYALSLMALLHAGIAFAGAWMLARHFGCGRGAAALAGVGYVGCGAYFSLLSSYTLFGSMAWFPWVLTWADECLQAPEGERWWRPGLLAGGALGLQLLNGEPSTVVMTGLALLALAAAAGRRPAAVPRVLLPVVFALALAAVQLLPTLGRLADSPRVGLPSRMATLFSMPPERLAELAFPRLFGDPRREVTSLFFGQQPKGQFYPYVESLYPGLLLTVLGASALLLYRVPRRAAWTLSLAAGCVLAFGGQSPIYEGLRRAIPPLAVLRFPEKFIILAVLALVVAGVLGWQRLLDDREAGRPQSADFPLAVASVVLATALGLTALLFWTPRAAWFNPFYNSPDLSPAHRAIALAYLRGESWAAVATAAAVVALLALCRWRRPSRRLLEVLAVVILATDLWYYGHGWVQIIPAAAYRNPPPLAAALQPARDRIAVQEATAGAPFLLRDPGDLRSLDTRVQLMTLEPYSNLLWHIPSAFDTDFELFLSDWARRAKDVLLNEKGKEENRYRYLGIWNVRTILLQKTLQEQRAASGDPAALPLRRITNRYVLPRFRFVPRVTFHPSHAAALAAARAADWRVAREEQCVRLGQPPGTLAFTRAPRLLEVADEGGRIAILYRAGEGAFFVAAMTYDKGWQAFLDGRTQPTYPTAACQLGVALPPGEHRLVLRYREPLIIPGAAVSLIALAGGAAALLATGRRRRMA